MSRNLRVLSLSALFLVSVGYAPAALAQNGSLKVSSFPSGAEVFVDGASTGKYTPMSISLSVGEHAVTVQFPGSGWRADSRIVTIAGGNNDLSVTLMPELTEGPMGHAGPQGPQGEVGPIGPQGPQGLQGEVGPIGPQGLQGPQGEIGPIGPQGLQGPQGESGPTGAQGPQGLQGEVGPVGPAGESVVMMSVGAGDECPFGGVAFVVGAETTYACNGAPGADGLDGAEGPQGPQGDIGPIGPQGLQGPQGETGPTGAQGPQGPQGETGPAGAQGPQGPQGDVGPVGPLGPAGESVAMMSVGAGDDCSFGGVAFVVGAETTYACNGAPGADGLDGAEGPQGLQGEIGPAGPTGPQGPEGPVGSEGPVGPEGPAGVDTITSLACLPGQTPTYSGGEWHCAGEVGLGVGDGLLDDLVGGTLGGGADASGAGSRTAGFTLRIRPGGSNGLVHWAGISGGALRLSGPDHQPSAPDDRRVYHVTPLTARFLFLYDDPPSEPMLPLPSCDTNHFRAELSGTGEAGESVLAVKIGDLVASRLETVAPDGSRRFVPGPLQPVRVSLVFADSHATRQEIGNLFRVPQTVEQDLTILLMTPGGDYGASYHFSECKPLAFARGTTSIDPRAVLPGGRLGLDLECGRVQLPLGHGALWDWLRDQQGGQHSDRDLVYTGLNPGGGEGGSISYFRTFLLRYRFPHFDINEERIPAEGEVVIQPGGVEGLFE